MKSSTPKGQNGRAAEIVVAVIFLPPTLVASNYGMNFRFLPELDWPYGYPLALGVMALSALVPVLYFRRKGWL